MTVALKLLLRGVLALLIGWFSLLLPVGIASLFGVHGWAFMHSELPLFFFPLGTAIAFWLLGFVPFLRFPKSPDTDADT